MALLDAERLRVSCCCFLMCGMDATDNGIGDAGAVALAKALESGQCQLDTLDLRGESMCLCRMRCWAVRLSFRLAWSLSVRGVRLCVWSGGRGWRFWMLTDCGCAAVFDGGTTANSPRTRCRALYNACVGSTELRWGVAS